MHEQWRQVDDYLTETLVGPDAALDAALARSEAAGLPAINVAPNQGKLLHLLARLRGARRILEIGTLGGYSTIWLARALPEDGRLLSLEVNEAHAAVARDNLAGAGLQDRAEVRVGAAGDSLDALLAAGEAPFDLIFIDADKANNPRYLEAALALSRPGTLIVCDNVVRGGRVLQAESPDPDVQGVRSYLSAVAAHPGLLSTAVQTVGCKGWDGLALSLVL